MKDFEPWLADTEATSGPGGLEVVAAPSSALIWSSITGGPVILSAWRRRCAFAYARPIRWVDGEPVLVERNAA